MITLFQDMFGIIDTVTLGFTAKYSSAVITTVTPVLAVGLTLSLIIFGLMSIYSTIDMTLTQLLRKCGFFAIVLSVGSVGGLYQTSFSDAILATPDKMASVLLSQSNNTKKPAATLIDEVANTGFTKAGELWEEGSFLNNAGPLGYAVIIFFSTLLVVSVGGGLILVAKVCLAVLVGIGPLFIFALMFEYTKRLFDSWISEVISYSLLVVLLSAVFGLFLALFNGYLHNLNIENQNPTLSVGGVGAIAIITLIVLWQLPAKAQALSNGVALGLDSFQAVSKALQHASGASLARKALKRRQHKESSNTTPQKPDKA